MTNSPVHVCVECKKPIPVYQKYLCETCYQDMLMPKDKEEKYSLCKRMTVHAIGLDTRGNIEYAHNGNKDTCTGEEGNCGCIHAEARLLEKMPNPLDVTVSHAPCLDCAKKLVKAGVRTVMYLKAYRLTEGVEYLTKNGVLVFSMLKGDK